MKNNHAPYLYSLFPLRTMRAAAVLAAALLTAHLAPAQTSTNVWTGGGTDLKWSDANNWSLGVVPTEINATPVAFLLLGANNASPGPNGISNNVVDVNTTIAELIYDHTNCYQTTYISTNVTLTVGGSQVIDAATFLVGSDNSIEGATGESTTATNYTTILGPGTLSFTNSQILKVRQGAASGGNHRAILDMSGLSTFNVNASQIQVAADGSGSGYIGDPTGTLLLAQTNLIVCSASPGIFLGQSQGSAGEGVLYLGQTNAIFCNYGVRVGDRKCTNCWLGFNTSAAANLVNPTALFRNSAGTGPMSYFGVSDLVTGQGSTPGGSGTADFTGAGGYVDLQATYIYIGRGQGNVTGGGSGAAGIGTLTWTNGIITAGTLMEIGASTTVNCPGQGTVNLGGTAQLNVGNGSAGSYLRLGYLVPSSTYSYPVGVLNIGKPVPGGSVWVNGPVVEGGGGNGGTALDAISVLGGSLKVSGMLGNTNSTPASAGPLESMTLSNATLTFDLGSTPNPASNNAWWQVATLNVTAPVTNNVLGSALTTGRFTLLKYASLNGDDGSAFIQSWNTLPPRVGGYFTNDTTDSRIDLVITNVSTPKWNGQTNNVNIGNWDINTTANWLPITGSGAITYLQPSVPGEAVLFDDSAAGTTTVNLTTNLSPSAITLKNSAKNYTFAGSGGLSGPTGLTKNGTGSLTITNTGTNTFTGAVAINQGAVILSGAANQLPTNAPVTLANDSTASLTLNNTNQMLGSLAGGGASGGNVNLGAGTLTLNGGSASYNGVISGGGSVVLSSGSETFSGANLYSGGTLVSGGTLKLANTSGSGVGPGSITVQPGGTLQIGDGGADGSIAVNTITNNGTVVLDRSDDLTLTNLITGTGGFNQEGPNNVTITNANNYAGPTLVDNGTLLVTASGALGTGQITISSVDAVHLYLANGITLANPLWVMRKTNAGTGAAVDNQGGTNILTGSMTFDGGGTYWNIESDAGDLIIRGAFNVYSGDTGTSYLRLAGAGNGELWCNICDVASGGDTVVNVSGGGIWTLWATNTYTGSTGVTGGSQLNVNGALTGSPTVTASGAALSGNGLIAGAVALNSGGILCGNSVLSTGVPSGAPAGQLTISNSLTLDGSSTIIMGVSDSGCDQVAGLTSLTFGGGTVQVVVTGTLVGGEAFKLFSAGAYNGSFSPNMPYIGPFLNWDYSTLAADGTLRVTGSVPIIGQIIQRPDGNFQLTGLNGTAGYAYSILATTNVSLPVAEWTQLSSGNFSGSPFTFTDLNATNYPQRFYLLSVPY
jgi:autotransporter-associated beta strand protein